LGGRHVQVGRVEPQFLQQVPPPTDEDGPTLNFEYEVKFTRPAWPAADGGQNATQHLDIAVADLDETVRWAITVGATLADVQPQQDVRVMLDPAGHPFCLFEDDSMTTGVSAPSPRA
jgi:hypothetical protein